MAFAVGHDNGLKNRLQHRVGELKLHLPPAGLGVAQFAQPHRNPVQLAGDHAKAVAAAPFHAVFKISLGNAMRIARQALNRPQHKENRGRRNHHRGHAYRVRQMQLPGGSQRAVRGNHQAHGQAAEEHTTENQSLGKIEHVRFPCQ